MTYLQMHPTCGISTTLYLFLLNAIIDDKDSILERVVNYRTEAVKRLLL